MGAEYSRAEVDAVLARQPERCGMCGALKDAVVGHGSGFGNWPQQDCSWCLGHTYRALFLEAVWDETGWNTGAQDVLWHTFVTRYLDRAHLQYPDLILPSTEEALDLLREISKAERTRNIALHLLPEWGLRVLNPGLPQQEAVRYLTQSATGTHHDVLPGGVVPDQSVLVPHLAALVAEEAELRRTVGGSSDGIFGRVTLDGNYAGRELSVGGSLLDPMIHVGRHRAGHVHNSTYDGFWYLNLDGSVTELSTSSQVQAEIERRLAHDDVGRARALAAAAARFSPQAQALLDEWLVGRDVWRPWVIASARGAAREDNDDLPSMSEYKVAERRVEIRSHLAALAATTLTGDARTLALGRLVAAVGQAQTPQIPGTRYDPTRNSRTYVMAVPADPDQIDTRNP